MSTTSKTTRRRSARGSGDQLRGEILAAARTLLAETGNADAVSIRAVAEMVGVTSPSIYLHFADKQALLDAVLSDVFAELDEKMNAGPSDVHPLERLCQQGMAYIRFALESPEHYRLAVSSVRTELGDVDMVLQTAAFEHFRQTVEDCMEIGAFAKGDPIPVAIDLWAAAHGIVSLLIAKPYLPWGDKEEVAYRILRAAGIGRAVSDYLGGPDPVEFAEWMASLPPRSPS